MTKASDWPHSFLAVSAAFGGGHRQASLAVTQALQARYAALGRPPPQAAMLDTLELLRPAERAIIMGVYSTWLEHAPEFYRGFYNWSDRVSEPKLITSSFHWLGSRGFNAAITRHRPELIVGTFPTVPALVHTVRRRRGLSFLNALVLTDYRVHHHWARPEADLILLPNCAARAEMLAWGLDGHKLEVTGLPVTAEITRLSRLPRAQRRAGMLRALGWADDSQHPVIVVSGGSGTYRAFDEIISQLSCLGTEVNVLVVAGPKPPCREQLGGAAIHHLGYRADLPSLLAGADLLVGKAGGMTVAETTALGLPMVVYRPIPGQEEHNARYLVRGGAALWPSSAAELRQAVWRFLDPQARQAAALASAGLGRPDAAQQAADALLRHWQAGSWRKKA